MSLSLVIYDHPTPEEAFSVLATKDPLIIDTVRRMLCERLEGKPTAGKVVTLKRHGSRATKEDQDEQ